MRKLRVTARKTEFIPQTMGIFVLFIIVLAFTVGLVRQELALALAGAAFLLPWTYCLVMTLFLALLHSRRVRRVTIRISPREITAGEFTEAFYTEGETAAPAGKIIQLPGILVRCRLILATADGRYIRYDFNPADPHPHLIEAKKRGAYFSVRDEFAVFDILGFFRFAYRLTASNLTTSKTAKMSPDEVVRLLVSPHPAEETPDVNARAGDTQFTPETSFQRTDNFVDNRPYVPGDDPRRINWKLYSHGSGLFVREAEREPPPHSNVVILIDNEYDPMLFSIAAARRGIDALCENALAVAIACAESGMNVLIGYIGCEQVVGNFTGVSPAKELASALARPAARSLSFDNIFPPVPAGLGILVLALPRVSAETSALDRFLKGKTINQTIDVLLICDNDSTQLTAAETCAAMYNRRAGVKARAFFPNSSHRDTEARR
ncbi:MAG: DUF58 domain-containing protein [Treponema sp.]|nr:DUF58 domain-containing protein [Treponema sp.]